MSLLALQRGFRDHVLAEAAADPSALGVGAAGLAVYRHAYRAQLVACLRDTYEKTWAWLGDEGFDAAAAAHVADHRPKSWTLADYGEGFADTLAGRHPDDPEVAELARLDWRLRRAFDGEDADPVAAEVVAAADWETAVLVFVPTLAIDPVVTNSGALWAALAEDEVPPGAERLPEPAATRTWRAGLSPRFRTIDAVEASALARAMEGASFATLCADLAETLGVEAAQRAGALLGAWLRDGLVTAIR